MLSKEGIYSFVNREKVGVGDPSYIWVIDPFRSGKTTITRQLEEEFSLTGKKINRFTDGKYFMDIIQEDAEHLLHQGEIKPDGTRTIVVTSGKFDDEMNKRLIDDISTFKGDVCLIEKASGYDSQGIRNFSLCEFMKIIPPGILSNSLFVYLKCSYEERYARNRVTKGQTGNNDFSAVNPKVFERFSTKDDFQEWSALLKEENLPLIVLNTSKNVG